KPQKPDNQTNAVSLRNPGAIQTHDLQNRNLDYILLQPAYCQPVNYLYYCKLVNNILPYKDTHK
ncbi:hypothetical protein LJC72_10095, partial [Bacteroides sp. OttesenSCG-928-D19]|nr:hypothetical protein [Bacteroides sp. OttesenSCG-928-D19]